MVESQTSSAQDLVSHLGNFKRDFRTANYKVKRDLRIEFGLLLIILALLSLFVAIASSWQAVKLHGKAILLHTLPYPILIFLISLITAILLLAFTRRHRHDKVSLYENGLVLQTGKKVNSWLWEATKSFNAEITAIKFGTSQISEKYKLSFENEGGQNLIIPGRYAEMDSLVENVRSALLPRMYIRMTSLLRDGNTIRFTPDLSVILKGVILKGDLCRWASINPPIILKHKLNIYRAGDNQLLYQCPIKTIKNLDLLLTLFKNPPM